MIEWQDIVGLIAIGILFGGLAMVYLPAALIVFGITGIVYILWRHRALLWGK
jgi:hypothetical protein